MKIVQPWTVGPLALGAATLLRGWLGSMRFSYFYDDPSYRPETTKLKSIFLFWHEMMLFPAYSHRWNRFAVLSSLHTDGEVAARMLGHLGFGVIRGSTRKNGLSALRELMRCSRFNHIAITPDGPRGPRRVVHPGAVFLASRTGMPILPAGFAFDDCWHLKNWDRTALPKPCSHGVGFLGLPIFVPPDLCTRGLSEQRQRVQHAMDDIQARAEATAGSVFAPTLPRKQPKPKLIAST